MLIKVFFVVLICFETYQCQELNPETSGKQRSSQDRCISGLERASTDEISAHSGLSKPKINFCCPRGEFFRSENETYECYVNPEKPIPLVDIPPIYSKICPEEKISLSSATHFDVMILQKLDQKWFYSISSSRKTNLLENGTLYIKKYEGSEEYMIEYEDFCFAIIEKKNHTIILGIGKSGEIGENENDVFYTILNIALIINIPFLFATFFIHIWLRQLRNFRGILTTAYVFSLSISSSLIVFLRFNGPGDFITCVTSGFVTYFFYIMSFSWLSALNFYIFWAFKGKASIPFARRQCKTTRLIIYTSYACSIPLILTGICLATEFIPMLSSYLPKPKFGVKYCWFIDFKTTLLYFYGPIGVIMIFDIYFFIYVVMKYQKFGGNSNSDNIEQFNKNKRRFDFYLKLFVVTGISWTFEVLSFLFGGEPHNLWIVTDFFNALLGLWIFLVTISDPKVRQSLADKIFCKKEKSQTQQPDSAALTSQTTVVRNDTT